jgi:putative ABC transport system permease protein
MTDALYLAWRYLAYHKVKTAILVTSITLIVFLPVGLRVLVRQSEAQLTARAAATPLLVGAKGSPLELALNSLYFEGDVPEPTRYAQAIRVDTSGLALAIPLYVRFEAQGHPIVGTTLEYFAFRGLRVASGSGLTMLGDCVLGARAAEVLGVGPGDRVISSPESVFDLAGVYPLRMHVRGVLEFSDGPDDLAIFVDLKTAWVIAGLVHGHVDLSAPAAAGQVLQRDSGNVVGNASVVQYQEITADNLGEFHFHGDQGEYPITAVIAVPPDQRDGTILRGRYSSPDDPVQIIEPTAIIDELLDTVLTVQTFVIAAVVVVGSSTLATAILVFMLSLRLRRREIETMRKIGGARASIGWVMVSEIVVVLVVGVVLAGGLTVVTSRFGSAAIRAVIF